MPPMKKCMPGRSRVSVDRSRRGREGDRMDVSSSPPPEGSEYSEDQQEREEQAEFCHYIKEEYCVSPPPPQEPSNDANTPITGRSKRRKIPALILTVELQDSIRDWYFENECLYDKRHPQYHTAQKDRLWAQKAEELLHQGVKDITGPRLFTWVYGVRTDYSKLTKEKRKCGAGGSDQNKLTPRMKWVLEKWNFLEEHIYRRNQGGKEGLRTSVVPKHLKRAQPQDITNGEDEDSLCDIATHDTTLDLDMDCTTDTHDTTNNKRRKTQEVADLEAIMADYLQEMHCIHDDLRSTVQPQTPKDPEQAAFTAWFTIASAGIRPELWDQFQTDCHMLVRRYRDLARHLQTHTSN